MEKLLWNYLFLLFYCNKYSVISIEAIDIHDLI